MPHLFSRTRALLGVTSFAVLTAATLLGAPTLAQAATSSKLEPGQYVENLGMRRYSEPFVLQQLTDRTYMVFVSTHSATVYVGDQGVLVFDSLSNGYGQGVLDAINSITDLPVTGLVYSHHHLDHLSDAQLFVDAATVKGTELRIISSAAVASQVESYGTVIPAPTDVVASDPGSFTFEDLTVYFEGTKDTHSIDNPLFLLEQERVLHYLPEDFLPYFRLVGLLDIAPMEETLRYVKTLE